MNTAFATKGLTHRIVAILVDTAGSPTAGLSASLRIQRQSDGQYLQSDNTWDASPSDDPALTQTDNTNLPGVYHFDFALPDAVDRYTVRVDGSASAHPRYLFGRLIATVDRDGDLKLARAMLANQQQQAIATGVVTVMDDDGTTPLITLTPTVDDTANPTLNILTPS